MGFTQDRIHKLFTPKALTCFGESFIIYKNQISSQKGDDPGFMRFLQRFMYGRYGSDQLNLFLLVVYLLCWFLSLFARLWILRYVGLVAILLALFRILSRNLDRRRAENAKFLKLVRPVTQWIALRRTIHRDKEHCYFKCPNCGQRLRVPRGKGKITVTCRACGNTFQEKS